MPKNNQDSFEALRRIHAAVTDETDLAAQAPTDFRTGTLTVLSDSGGTAIYDAASTAVALAGSVVVPDVIAASAAYIADPSTAPGRHLITPPMAAFAGTDPGEGSDLVAYTDPSGVTPATTTSEAIDELEVDARTAQAFLPIPLNSFVVVSTGALLVPFNDGVDDGFDWIEGLAYRFNVASTAAIGTTVPLPTDLDDSADVVVHVLGARVGAADPTAALTVGAFFQPAGVAYDADDDAGGDTSAFDGATTVVTEETVTILAAAVPAVPAALSISLVPTAALDADDLRVIGVWLEYTRLPLTS